MSLQFLVIALVERVVEEEEGCELAFLIQSGVFALAMVVISKWALGHWKLDTITTQFWN